MSLLVTFNGVNYIIPQSGETGWGTNLDNYFVAIAAGALQKTGGNFTLSADTDFGASFGLKSLYYLSRNSNVAGTGILRLDNNSDAVSWRNAANSGDLALLANSSNQLQFNGTTLVDTAGAGLSKSGTTLSLSTPVSVSNGGTGDSSLTAYAILCGGTSSTNPIQSIASVGTSGQVLTSNGAGVLPTFQNVAGTGTVNTGTAGRLSLYPASSNAVSDTYVQNTRNITLAIAAQAARSTDLTMTIPNPGDAVSTATFALLESAQTFTGAKTFSANVNVTPSSTTAFRVGSTLTVDTTDDFIGIGADSTSPTRVLQVRKDQSGTPTDVTVENRFANSASDARFFSIVSGSTGGDPFTLYDVPSATFWAAGIDNSDSDKYKISQSSSLGTNDALVISTSGPAVSVHGTITNDNAAAGFIGETISSSANANAPATNVYDDLTSISLTAGDWLISGQLTQASSPTSISQAISISPHAGNDTTGLITGDNSLAFSGAISSSSFTSATIASYRVSLASTTTYYLKMRASYSTGTAAQNAFWGRITAVRIR